MELVAALVRSLKTDDGRDLLRHSKDQGSTSSGGGVDDTTARLLKELTEQFAEYKARVRPLLNAARESGQLAAGLEADTPEGITPRRGRRG